MCVSGGIYFNDLEIFCGVDEKNLVKYLAVL